MFQLRLLSRPQEQTRPDFVLRNMVGDTVIIVVQRFETEKQQMYGKIMSKW